MIKMSRKTFKVKTTICCLVTSLTTSSYFVKSLKHRHVGAKANKIKTAQHQGLQRTILSRWDL